MKKLILIKMSIILVFSLCFGCKKKSTADRPGGSLDGETAPIIWSGQYQQIRVGESLANGIFGHRPIFRAHDGDGYIDGVIINFSPKEYPIGATIGGMFDFTTVTFPFDEFTGTSSNHFTYVGMAMNGLISGDELGEYVIKVSQLSGNNSSRDKELRFYVIQDEEQTSFIDNPDWGHEIYNDVEIHGDGFKDPDEDSDDQNIKNLYIELDYDNNLSTSINEIIAIAETILNTGGFKVEITIHDGLNIGSNDGQLLMLYQNRKEIKKTLSETRTWKEYIHAILATDHSNNDLYGITMQYYDEPPNGEGWTHLDCARGASGMSDQNPSYKRQYLDSTGCMIFVKNIEQASLGNTTWNTNKAIGWTLAHEIGHAIGIAAHNPGKSIMSPTPFTNSTAFFDQYDEFGEWELYDNRSDRRLAINLRDILGRDNIDIAW